MICLRVGIVLGSVVLCATSLLAQEQPLGDMVKAQKAAKGKNPAAKVVGEEDLAQMRSRNHALGPATECDATCEAAARGAIEERIRKLKDAEWAEAFADGRDELETDSEWQEVFPDIQREVCMSQGEKAKNAERSQQAERKITAKMVSETRDVLQSLSLATDAKLSAAARQRSVREIRARAVKLQIMKFIVEKSKQGCGTR